MDDERDTSPTDDSLNDAGIDVGEYDPDEAAEAYAGAASDPGDEDSPLDDDPLLDGRSLHDAGWQAADVDAAAGDVIAAAPDEPPARERDSEPSSLDETERLRQPRALAFRRRLRQQIAMLPLALALIALGVFLSARAFEVEGLPEVDDATLALGFGGALAFTAVFHALVFGRRERGLLFFGLLPLVIAGLVYALIEFVEPEPDAAEWWPLVLVALGVALLLTYVLERARDVRLILLGVLALVAAGTAYTVTSGLIEQDWLDRAADYWPLLLAALGLGLLPAAFRRRAR